MHILSLCCQQNLKTNIKSEYIFNLIILSQVQSQEPIKAARPKVETQDVETRDYTDYQRLEENVLKSIGP